jgi:hypothetical protein
MLLIHNGNAPWRYVRFLNSAAELLLLRRAGSAYLFPHRMLLEYLAGLDADRPLEALYRTADQPAPSVKD